jgi:hypothetical protein
MQISRHWRLNSKRYRLEGVRYEDGAVSLQERPVTRERQISSEETSEAEIVKTRNTSQVVAA